MKFINLKFKISRVILAKAGIQVLYFKFSSRLKDGCAMRFRRLDWIPIVIGMTMRKKMNKGFILPFAMMLSYIILIISMGISDILTKEMFFSFIGRESQIAYYSADAGLDCALYLDAAFVDSTEGVGIFPYNKTDGTWESGVLNQSQYASAGGISTSTIRCAGAEIFNADPDKSNYKTTPIDGYLPANGVESTFMLRMVQGTTNDSCALVSIDKKVTTSTSTRRIISRGYNTCDMSSKKLVERAIVNMQ